jgi:phenylalanyl-tRNA synthetase beta chain
MTTLELADERRAHEPTLRPSILPSLLACRRANQDGQVRVPGGVRLFEIGAVFGALPTAPGSATGPGVVENQNLAILMDVPVEGKSASFEDRQRGVRLMRGVVEAVVRSCAGAGADLRIEPAEPHAPGLGRGAFARVSLGGKPLGYYGLIDPSLIQAYGLDRPVTGAELNHDRLLSMYPPRAAVRPTPQFPGIERDLSLIVADSVAWDRVRTAVEAARVDRLEEVAFVGTYRGKQTGPGRKSVTLRLRFRDPARTLRHDEVDSQVEAVVQLARRELGADLRTQ